MVDLLCLGLFYLIATFYLTRTIFIIMGWYKSPILRTFEKYGGEEGHFNILTWLFGWLGVFTILTSFWMIAFFEFGTPLWFAGGAMLLLSYLSFNYPRAFNGRYPDLLGVYPRWLSNLRNRTTRLERRRIAYMWRRLPLRTRIRYHTNDRAFLEWADMVILSTLM